MFYNTEYGFYDNAASKKDGLAAISVLLKVRQIPWGHRYNVVSFRPCWLVF